MIRAGIVPAAAVLVLGLAGPAWAGTDSPTVCNPGGYACGAFLSNGDAVTVRDGVCDGHAAVVQVYAPDAPVSDNLWNTDGCGTTRTYTYGSAMPENITVSIRACSGVWSTKELYGCSGWVSGVS